MGDAEDVSMTLPEAYQLFDLPRAATFQVVRKRYLDMVVLHHPDRGGDAFVYRMLQQAYQVILQSQREFRRDENHERWSNVLDEVRARREEQDDQLPERLELSTDLSAFNQVFESRYRSELMDQIDPVEWREARRQVMLGSTSGQDVSSYILTEWKDSMADALNPIRTISMPLDASVGHMNRTNVCSTKSYTDVIEAFGPPPVMPEYTGDTSVPSLDEIMGQRDIQVKRFQEERHEVRQARGLDGNEDEKENLDFSEFEMILDNLQRRLVLQ